MDILLMMICRRNCTWRDQVVTENLSGWILCKWWIEHTNTEEESKTVWY
jgi:hypothetical protein